MDELLGDFLGETGEMLAEIAGAIVAWEANPADQDRLGAIFRFVHTVKGSSSFLTLPGSLRWPMRRRMHSIWSGAASARPTARWCRACLGLSTG